MLCILIVRGTTARVFPRRRTTDDYTHLTADPGPEAPFARIDAADARMRNASERITTTTPTTCPPAPHGASTGSGNESTGRNADRKTTVRVRGGGRYDVAGLRQRYTHNALTRRRTRRGVRFACGVRVRARLAAG